MRVPEFPQYIRTKKSSAEGKAAQCDQQWHMRKQSGFATFVLPGKYAPH